MEQTDPTSIKCFAEYLNNLRAVNLYITLENNYVDSSDAPLLSVASNDVQIPRLGKFKIVLNELNLEDCSDLPPRSIDSNILCYRLVVRPESGCGSAAAEIVSNFEKTVDEGAKNLVKNSINNVALKEGTFYQLKCRFCSKFMTTDKVKFDRIRPLPSKNWVENAHELWYCHPPEPSSSEGLHQDMSVRMNKINLENSNDNSNQNKSIVELLNNPDINYCFYGPCNWALNKNIVKGICRNDAVEDLYLSRADCMYCGKELGSFTSEHCVKIWDYGVEWVNEPEVDQPVSSTSTSIPSSENNVETETRAFHNFKSIVFATIYELSDHPTFRFSVSSVFKGNSVFLWNIDRNLSVFQQKVFQSNCNETCRLERSKVAKFFFAIRENNLLNISDPREVLIIQESEQNDQSILTIPDYVYRVGVEKLKKTSVMYSRNEQTLQCGYLPYDV